METLHFSVLVVHACPNVYLALHAKKEINNFFLNIKKEEILG
jgi:hypothetical protein